MDFIKNIQKISLKIYRLKDFFDVKIYYYFIINNFLKIKITVIYLHHIMTESGFTSITLKKYL